MKLGAKFQISFLMISLIGGLIGYVGFSGVNDVFTIFDGIVDDTAPELILLGQIESLSRELQLEAVSYVLLTQASASDTSIHEELEEFEETNIELDKIILELREHEEAEEEEEPEEMEFLEQVIVSKAKLYDASLAIISGADKGVSSQIITIMKETLEQAEEELHEVIEIRIELEKAELERQDAIADELSFNTSNLIIIVSVIGVIFALSLGILLPKTILRPLSQLKDAAKLIDKGNFEVSIKPHGDDETKDLIKSFNSMARGLKKTRELELEKQKNEKISTLGNITSSLAHNLKNPLTVIKATTNIIESTTNTLDEKTKDRLTLINISIENMLNQIEDILDFVKQKPLELEKNSLSKILNIAMKNIKKPERIKINFPEKDIMIICDASDKRFE